MLTPSQIDRKFALQAELSKDVRDHTVLTPLHAAAEGSADAAAEAEVTGVTHRKTPVCLDEAHQDDETAKQIRPEPAGYEGPQVMSGGRFRNNAGPLADGHAANSPSYDAPNTSNVPTSSASPYGPCDRPSDVAVSNIGRFNSSDGHSVNLPGYDNSSPVAIPELHPKTGIFGRLSQADSVQNFQSNG